MPAERPSEAGITRTADRVLDEHLRAEEQRDADHRPAADHAARIGRFAAGMDELNVAWLEEPFPAHDYRGLTVTEVNKDEFRDTVLKTVSFESFDYRKADWERIQAVK